MQLRVQHENGEMEELTLIDPVIAIPAKATLWRLQDAAGVEHYFTEDGYYDGQGGLSIGMEP